MAAAKKAARKRVVLPAEDASAKTPATSEWASMKNQIAKDRGEGVVISAGAIPPACHIPTGAFTFDFATLGGPPEGFCFMLFGIESCGKTTMMLKTVAGYQRKHPDKVVVWFDPENMFDAEWAEQLGCDLSRLDVIQPETGEETVDLIAAAMEAMEVGFVVLDSVPGCVPKAIVDRSAEDDTMGALARLMGKLSSKILMTWSKERRRGHRVTVGLINQIRLKVGFVLGNPHTRPGGRQINHLPTLIAKLTNKEIKGEDGFGLEVVNTNDHSFTIEKAKHGASIRSGEFQMVINPDLDPLIAQGGFDDFATVLTYSKKFGLLKGGGGSYRIPLVGAGPFAKHEAVIQWLKANPEPYEQLRASLIALQRHSKGLPLLPPDGYLCAPGIQLPEGLDEYLSSVDSAE